MGLSQEEVQSILALVIASHSIEASRPWKRLTFNVFISWVCLLPFVANKIDLKVAHNIYTHTMYTNKILTVKTFIQS